MRDYHWVLKSGERIAIAQMPTADIHDTLQRTGVKMMPHSEVTAAAVEERLRLELFIREKGLRDD